MKKFIFASLAIGMYLGFSCTYDKQEDPTPVHTSPTDTTTTDSTGNNSGTCDSVDAKFAADILPIFNNNCSGCHTGGGNSGGIILDVHSNVVADTTKLKGSINHNAGFSPMPDGGPKLSDADIEKIECWIANGAQDN